MAVHNPPAKIYAIQRLARQRKRLASEIGSRKKRIGSIVDGYFPGMRQAFSDPWSAHARASLRSRLNPLAVVHAGEKALHAFLTKARQPGKADAVESHLVYLACQDAATLYKLSSSVGNPAHFRSQSAFANYSGVVPAAKQSTDADRPYELRDIEGNPISNNELFVTRH